MPSPRMHVPDSDIHRTAMLWIQQHGEGAITKAREMVEDLWRKGDAESADVWLRIVVAIGAQGTQPSDARH